MLGGWIEIQVKSVLCHHGRLCLQKWAYLYKRDSIKKFANHLQKWYVQNHSAMGCDTLNWATAACGSSFSNFILHWSGILGDPTTFTLSIKCSSRILLNLVKRVKKFSFCHTNHGSAYIKRIFLFASPKIHERNDLTFGELFGSTTERATNWKSYQYRFYLEIIILLFVIIEFDPLRNSLCLHILIIIENAQSTLGVAWNMEIPMVLLNVLESVVWHKLVVTFLKKTRIF